MGFKISRSQALIDVISEEPITEYPILDFEEYKALCIEYGDTPAPSFETQNEHPAHVETIGRDRAMYKPIEAKIEELHHTHIWQEGCCWEDDTDGLNVQWASTSNSYIVYSYFKDKDDDHHFYIIDYCGDGAHELIKDESQVLDWVRQANEFRNKKFN